MAQARALVLSIDAMTGEDLKKAVQYPNFGRLMENCALATEVESVFPSLTYPCHVAMATGCTPAHTQILNNEIFLPETLRRPWYFYTRQIGRPTIFAAARAAGISTGCVMWPCMGKGPIDTLVPEIWGEDPNGSFLEPFCAAGTSDFIREIWPEVGNIPRGFAQPMFDTFVCRTAVEIIRRRQPELLYVHICQIDNAKHYAGLNTPEVDRAIQNTDALLGSLLQALEEKHLREDTHIVLCSDHGQLPVKEISYPNRLLAAHGLMKMQGSEIPHWSAQVQSACLSATLYSRDAESTRKALRLLEANRDALGIEEIVLPGACAKRFCFEGNFSAVLLGKPGIYFSNDAHLGPLRLEASLSGLSYKANHGHNPQLGEKPFFLIAGKRANSGARLQSGVRLIDEPVTVASLLGFDMPEADGHVIQALLKH